MVLSNQDCRQQRSLSNYDFGFIKVIIIIHITKKNIVLSFLALFEHVLKIFLELYFLDLKAFLKQNYVILFVSWTPLFVVVLLQPYFPFLHLCLDWFDTTVLHEVTKVALMQSLPSFKFTLYTNIGLFTVIFFIIAISSNRIYRLIHPFIHQFNIFAKTIFVDTVLLTPICLTRIVESIR